MPATSSYQIYSPYAPQPKPTTGGAQTPYTSLLGQYNQVPQPTGGSNSPYGAVPGTTPLPPSIYSQTQAADPGLAGGNDQLNANIISELQGQLSPQVLNNLQDTAARFGVSSGMPGSNATPGSIAFNGNLLNNVQTTQQRQAQGLKDYQSQENLVAGQQLNPSLINKVQTDNATLAAAPNPTLAAQTALNNYYAALNAAKGPGGGTGSALSPTSGTGSFSTTLPFYGGTPSPTLPQGTTDTSGTITSSSPYGTVDQSQTINDLFNSDFGMGGGTYTSNGVPTDTNAPPIDASNQNTWDFTDPSNWDSFYG